MVQQAIEERGDHRRQLIAGFEVSINYRFWVSTEVNAPYEESSSVSVLRIR